MVPTDRRKDLKSKIENGLDSLLGRERVPKADELAEAIVLRLKERVQAEKWKAFPYKILGVRLQPSTKRMAAVFKKDLIESGSLKGSLSAALKGYADLPLPEDLELSVALEEPPIRRGSAAAPPSLFRIEFLEPVRRSERQVPKQRIEILKGRAGQRVYQFSKDRMLIGCLPEVYDKEGRLVRKNNVVFPHKGDEINATVSTMHARVWFDPEIGEFRIMDESSRYGTRLVRAGHSIEVPAENLRGVGLRSGDEICFGQACVLFLLIDDPE